MDRSAGVFGLTARELDVTLFCRLCDDLLSLLEGQRVPERIAVDTAHVIHADRRDSSHPRVDLGRTDDKASTAADPKNTNARLVDKPSRAQEIHPSTESLGINIWQNRVARLALALSPERQIEG